MPFAVPLKASKPAPETPPQSPHLCLNAPVFQRCLQPSSTASTILLAYSYTAPTPQSQPPGSHLVFHKNYPVYTQPHAATALLFIPKRCDMYFYMVTCMHVFHSPLLFPALDERSSLTLHYISRLVPTYAISS